MLFTLLILVQIWALAQAWLLPTQDIDQNLQYIMLGIAYSTFFVLLLAHFANRNALNKLIITLIVGGTIQAFIGAATVLNLIDPLFTSLANQPSAHGTYINRNHFAGYLLMTIALAIGLLLAQRDNRDWSWKNLIELLTSYKMLIRLALIIMVIGLVMSHSRMGNAAFVIALSIIGAFFILKTATHRIRNSLLLLSFILIDIMIISQFFGLEQLKDRLTQTQITVSEQQGKLLLTINDLRSPINQNSVQLLEQAPFVGKGAGSFENAFKPLAGPNYGGRIDHAHNDYLEFWIEYGVIGILPLGVFLLGALGMAIKAIRNQKSTYRSGIGLGSSMALIAIALHSATDFNLHIPANALTLISVCAIAVLAAMHKNPKHRRSAE
ncbi:polymerase [Thiosulfatimonas sediminis]|uniref:Polymerase n=1 Tax=Thiosulfatimonas sediminis TaxID=2675054 RepID=A0A6F8PT55_9GAMM|nr:O-antigen ligase family protein [Thiosulfatimonas sediminis]BBP45289.1 polymerase [Thiosulfatimonas sediminis]